MPTNPASSSSVDLEAIVRMVVERLRHDASSDDDRAAVDGNQHSAACRINEHVVSMESLRGRLDNIVAIQISRKAVLTPSARDELRSRGIELCRADLPMKEHAGNSMTGAADQEVVRRPLQLLAFDSPACASVANVIGRRCATDARKINRLQDAAQVLRDHAPGSFCVLVTENPHQLIWDLHAKGKRAILCRAPGDVEEGRQCIQADSFVIDARCALNIDIVDAIANLTVIQT